MTEFFAAFYERLFEVMIGLAPSTLAMAAVCTVLYFCSGQACNPGMPWWRNRGLITDAWYWLIIPFMAPYIRTVLFVGIAAFTLPFMTQQQVGDYVANGYGPVAALGFWGQIAFYLLVSDFLLYWVHRKFHGVQLWRFHAIHHSAEDVDWTTAYRFHPVNLCLGPFLVDVLMLYAGVSPKVLLALAPFQTLSALFVHANLKWTFGPLKYIFATPVFHRWHHTSPEFGGDKNFAPAFSFWDVLFGTFYMPKGELPQNYGVVDRDVPENFWQQLAYPFIPKEVRERDGWTGNLSASPSALESAGPPRGS